VAQLETGRLKDKLERQFAPIPESWRIGNLPPLFATPLDLITQNRPLTERE
jgi:hypothetical protein